jgi:hypothetical protein
MTSHPRIGSGEARTAPNGSGVPGSRSCQTMKGRDVAAKDFPAVAAYAKAKFELSEKATR